MEEKKRRRMRRERELGRVEVKVPSVWSPAGTQRALVKSRGLILMFVLLHLCSLVGDAHSRACTHTNTQESCHTTAI